MDLNCIYLQKFYWNHEVEWTKTRLFLSLDKFSCGFFFFTILYELVFKLSYQKPSNILFLLCFSYHEIKFHFKPFPESSLGIINVSIFKAKFHFIFFYSGDTNYPHLISIKIQVERRCISLTVMKCKIVRIFVCVNKNKMVFDK